MRKSEKRDERAEERSERAEHAAEEARDDEVHPHQVEEEDADPERPDEDARFDAPART